MPRGRPTKLTTEVQTAIVDAIHRGAYIETAAQLAGIGKVTFYDWLKTGARLNEAQGKGVAITKKKDLALVDFSNAVKRATAHSELRDIEVIDNAAQEGAWQAAAWKLERKHHQRWGRKVAITDEEGGNFFTGMARAWAEALESDLDDSNLIEGELDVPLIGKVNGNGSA